MNMLEHLYLSENRMQLGLQALHATIKTAWGGEVNAMAKHFIVWRNVTTSCKACPGSIHDE